MMDGGRGDIPAPLWADAAALQADIFALENPEKDPARTAAAIARNIKALRAAKQGRTRVTQLYPAVGRQRAEKSSSASKERRGIYVEFIKRLDPSLCVSGGGVLTIAALHKAICGEKNKDTGVYENGFIQTYRRDVWPYQKDLKSMPPRGSGFDDLLWQLFKLQISPIISDPTMREIASSNFEKHRKHRRDGKRRRN